MSDINLKPTELLHILKEVKCITGFDFSEYANSFIKRRTELLMYANKITSEADLIYRINQSEGFAGQFLETIFIPQSELFRDAEMWNYLESKILTKLIGKKELNIHLPYSTSSEELFSLLFILSKFDTTKVKITVTAVTDKHLSLIKKGEFNAVHVKASVKNLELLDSAIDSDDIFSENKKLISVKHNFEGNIIYETCDFLKGDYFSEFDLIFFRNSMLYFNAELKEKMLKTVIRSLKKGAFLFIGEKETIGNESGKKIKQVVRNLSIYKKKTFT